MSYIKKFIQIGLCNNKWLWFHTLCTVLFFVLSINYFTFFDARKNANLLLTYIIILIATIGWEIIEWFLEIEKHRNSLKQIDWLKTNYKSKENWWYDTLGDIVFCNIIAIIMIFGYF